MKTLLKSLIATGVLTAAASVTAAPIVNVSYDPDTARANFEASLNGPTVTENFNGLGDESMAERNGVHQYSWENRSQSFTTAVGTFALTPGQNGQGGVNLHNDQLMIESHLTGEFGRSTLSDGTDGDLWLDSNDGREVTWTLGDPLNGHFNALGFYLGDPSDVSAKFTLMFDDGTSSDSFTINANTVPNGNVAYVTIVSDKNIVGGTITFRTTTGNDGWGIDDVTVGRVPEPGTLLLMGLGLLGLGAARRRTAA